MNEKDAEAGTESPRDAGAGVETLKGLGARDGQSALKIRRQADERSSPDDREKTETDSYPHGTSAAAPETDGDDGRETEAATPAEDASKTRPYAAHGA